VFVCVGGGSKDSLTSGALERITPLIRVSGHDEIVDNYDLNTVDTHAANQGK